MPRRILNVSVCFSVTSVRISLSEKSQDGVAIQEHNMGILLTWISHTRHPSIRDNPQILHLTLSRPSFFLQHSSHLRVQTTGYSPPDPFRRQATSNPRPPLNSEICSRPLGIPCSGMTFPGESEPGFRYRLLIVLDGKS